DARVQIGPAMRGTALRDSLDFVQFNDFTNQIDFAQFGKAFNAYADKTVLSKLPREALEGRTAKVLGAYTIEGGYPTARFWTLYAADQSLGVIDTGKPRPAALQSYDVLRKPDNMVSISVG
ncbi:DUF2291 family protein, partial [Mesorhizobium sp. M2E.F.Ca.ET.209.01.1.1]|uniref:DUF2291 family protein n=1 Tax=Mesorhizobium sp. M2E.F.Ca.ET.209.01.1.1 TaxID=2500526 RepID=UPI001FEF364D